VWLVHDFRSGRGADEGSKTVCGGLTKVGEESRLPGLEPLGDANFRELWYSIIPNMFSGFLLDVMIVVTPVSVAISAAMSFVSMPPVPRLEPSVLVLTEDISELQENIAKIGMDLECGLQLWKIQPVWAWPWGLCEDLQCKAHLHL
jgi:hypothetical protein